MKKLFLKPSRQARPLMRTRFRAIVTGEPLVVAGRARRTMYVATSLDWYMTSQGRTPRAAMQSLERLLVAQTYLLNSWRFRKRQPPGPAPADCQRAWPSGGFLCTDPQWAPYIPPSRVHLRRIIDLTKTQYRMVTKRGRTCPRP